ncbi:DUF5518 domain-containing protein [Natrialba sp. INN-245]|uniref:DUF5518 domain-containing protein n=1 Tax=Natrialba sp. INN-245 TaxID=2690967 RepID=UPI0013123AD9|nr:DUF5518 domain-containing protein [Natrialba sp. INN-245]MWV40880.1 hypothetical protein [Natrialba sp. INN-245]
MAASTKIVQWLLDEDVSVATALGFLSIPVTVAVSLSTGPSHYSAGPVVLAGFLAGLYYSTRSTSAVRAGLRTGVIGSLPAVWASASFVASGWTISPGYAALGVAFALLWHFLAFVAFGFFSVLGALVGNVIGRVPPFRRIGSTAV